jgi:hypothetical protein
MAIHLTCIDEIDYGAPLERIYEGLIELTSTASLDSRHWCGCRRDRAPENWPVDI